MTIEVFTIQAFAKTIEGGNMAGIVYEADSLSDEQMLKIAAKVGYSETAFLMQSELADYKVRYFTPNEEVDLCGHATIGLFTHMLQINKVETNHGYKIETKAGLLNVAVKEDGLIVMNQNRPFFGEVLEPTEIARSLECSDEVFAEDMPIQIVSTGLRDIIIPVKNHLLLDALVPNFDKIASISQAYDVVGYHVFTLDACYGGTAYCRNFAPLYNIPEEAATGTSNGALASYLYRYRQDCRKGANKFVFEQGYALKRPSEIRAFVEGEHENITEIKIGGRALGGDKIILKM